MKVKVNQEACIGCGACASIAGEVFEINDEGLSQVKGEIKAEHYESLMGRVINKDIECDEHLSWADLEA